MRFPFYIAARYLFSKKSSNAINFITGISVIGVAVGTFALIVVLSAFNGLENLVVSLFNSFDPDLKISIVEGKTFEENAIPKDAIKQIEGVAYYTEVLEENALLEHQKQQYIAKIKGVSNDFISMSGLDSMISEGELKLEENNQSFAVVGQGIAYSLSISPYDLFNPLIIYIPKAGNIKSTDPKNAFTKKTIHTSGIFSIQKDFDMEYVLVPIGFAKKLIGKHTELSAVEIGLDPEANTELVQKKIKDILGSEYLVKNRFQQHEFLYKIMKSEKLAVFLILTFILILATFNSVASVTMIIFDKQKDIGILSSMGAKNSTIKSIFLTEGILINLIGNLSGLAFGVLICYLQSIYGLIKFEGNFVTESIPVHVDWIEVIYIFGTVFLIGLLAAWIPTRKIKSLHLG